MTGISLCGKSIGTAIIRLTHANCKATLAPNALQRGSGWARRVKCAVASLPPMTFFHAFLFQGGCADLNAIRRPPVPYAAMDPLIPQRRFLERKVGCPNLPINEIFR